MYVAPFTAASSALELPIKVGRRVRAFLKTGIAECASLRGRIHAYHVVAEQMQPRSNRRLALHDRRSVHALGFATTAGPRELTIASRLWYSELSGKWPEIPKVRTDRRRNRRKAYDPSSRSPVECVERTHVLSGFECSSECTTTGHRVSFRCRPHLGWKAQISYTIHRILLTEPLR